MERIILASKSPDRRELFKQARIPIEVLKTDVDEEQFKKEIKDPIQLVMELARTKGLNAKEVMQRSKKEGIIIAADTVVELNGEIIGKALDEQDAFRILKKLIGKTHNLLTGIAITNTHKSKVITDYDSTTVKFLQLSDNEIWNYIRSGDWKGRAGAYTITEKASLFIEYIKGSPSNVIGLPMHKIFLILKNDFDFNILGIK
ncbi:MAG: septum formation protein Maf [Candidatus Lokiarchaeota archaeon]|nr:septum formation protein Maf [Candidatus Lokiarchaeota archaeon]